LSSRVPDYTRDAQVLNQHFGHDRRLLRWVKTNGLGETGAVAGKTANVIDAHVGSRVKMRRTLLGISQERLGNQLGITFQQVQKYEKGANRIGASRLQSIASALSVPIAYFFEGLAAGDRAGPLEDDTARFVSSIEGRELNRAFARIGDQRVRRRVIELVRSLAGDAD